MLLILFKKITLKINLFFVYLLFIIYYLLFIATLMNLQILIAVFDLDFDIPSWVAQFLQ